MHAPYTLSQTQQATLTELIVKTIKHKYQYHRRRSTKAYGVSPYENRAGPGFEPDAPDAHNNLKRYIKDMARH